MYDTGESFASCFECLSSDIFMCQFSWNLIYEPNEYIWQNERGCDLCEFGK